MKKVNWKNKEEARNWIREHNNKRYKEDSEFREKQKKHNKKYSADRYKIKEIKKKRVEYQRKYFENKLKIPGFRDKWDEYQKQYTRKPEVIKRRRAYQRERYWRLKNETKIECKED